MARRSGISPWIYAGCGCAALIGLVAVAVMAAGFFGVSLFKGYVEAMRDPVERDARALSILGGESLPEGYHARVFLSFPLVADLVILTDGPQDEIDLEEDFEAFDLETLGEHLFFYLSVRGDSSDEDELEDIFEGRRSRHVNIDLGSHFRSLEALGEGTLELDRARVDYASFRGELETEAGERVEGIYSQMQITCREGRARSRLALWFARDPAAEPTPSRAEAEPAERPVEALELPGSPADPEALEGFLGHFDLCAR